MQKDNVNKMVGGLHSDSSPIEQPKNTHRFALNAVDESHEGNLGFTINEESNEECFQLPEGYIPLGKVYIGNNRIAILSVSADGTTSEIGIADDKCNYTTHVNTTELGFTLKNQIQATYRLRRGCEDVIYFVQKDLKPMFYNFSKPDAFKTGGNWDANKFELRRSYDSIPLFDDVKVLNSGGQIPPGSYNIAVQYVDEDLNPTEWVTVSPIIYIYNDDTNEAYLDIRGSINSDTDYINFGVTDKSIRVVLDNLDQSFLFYRLAFIEASAGTGLVSAVNYTDNIPISETTFIYTGTNAPTEGTEEEIQAFSSVIDSAETIEQIENRLILGNTKGKQVNFCKLQKYASKIKTDLKVKEVLSNQISEGNPKNPTVHFEAVGYMPGEMYSFGIVYVFADGSISPTYHIPGKSPLVDSGTIFTPTDDTIYPMSNDNESETNVYNDNSSCENGDVWGIDTEGEALLGNPVRHHRFPLRTDIGVPLVEEIDSNEVQQQFWQLVFRGEGDISLPCSQEELDAGDCSPLQNAPIFQARVEFTVDGVAHSTTVTIDPSGESTPFSFEERGQFFTSSNIVITGIFESVAGVSEDVSTGGIGTDSATGGPSSSAGATPPDPANNILYTANVEEAVFSTEERYFKQYVYGVQFSGVEIPSLADTNGEEIVGYYIVRNERTELEKTILDSAVLVPTLSNEKYISHGLLGTQLTDTSRYAKNVFGFINPEFKFNDYKYEEVTDIIQQGELRIIDRKYSKARYRDVLDGTSFDDDIHKGGGGQDDDGWSLKAITRDNITEYHPRTLFNKADSDINQMFYLDALQSRDVNDDANTIYNIAGDNKVGILELNNDHPEDLSDRLPYVYFRRDNPNPYSTFRTLPYYKASTNVHAAADTVAEVFGGDTFITPMRYLNTVFWDNRIAERAGRTSVWNYIIGAILIVVGAVLLIVGGSGALVIGAGIAVIGGGALFVASGVKRDLLVKAYYEEYEKGLRETALDDWVEEEYKNFPCARSTGTTDFYTEGHGHCDTPEDDEIQWIGDCVTDMWFESKINMSVRNGFSVDTPTFIDGPGRIESGNEAIERSYEHFGIYKQRDDLLAPFTKLDRHIMEKMTAFDPERDAPTRGNPATGDSQLYIGHPLGEWYQVNPDYRRLNKGKIFYHLPLEYDCCSDCQEVFPQRVHYSEQSFQEELTDNYRVFLPLNYRDIEGEKGVITNLYRWQNNLFIHTEESLWNLPQNIQERITGEVTSFIGTGEFFSIPPRKIVDTDTASAGTSHRWGAVKTKHGIFFPYEDERKIFRFNGNELKDTTLGNTKWFKNNMQLKADRQIYEALGRPYVFANNPSNPFGTGFISTYDTNKERFIITKKDFRFIDEIANNTDFELCENNGDLIMFDGYQDTIDIYEAEGWNFVGIENCQMVFERTVYSETTETREVVETVSNTADIHIFYDTSGSFGGTYVAGSRLLAGDDMGEILNGIDAIVDDWVANFASANPNWSGNVYKYIDSSERWLRYAQIIQSEAYPLEDISTKDIILISFCNESNDAYHSGTFNNVIESPTTEFTDDYNAFLALHPLYKSFNAIHYPVVFDTNESSQEFLVHSLAALKGTSYSVAETDALTLNDGIGAGWSSLVAALQGPNPYPDDGLENYGWQLKEDRFYIDAEGGDVIDSQTFQDDIQELLSGISNVVEEEVTIITSEPEYEYIDGTVIENPIAANESWTMSFSMKRDRWFSWHSYLPNFYAEGLEKFYGWKHGNDYIWKFNKPYHYQTFFGVHYPHVIEFVSISNPIQTRIWDDITLQTEASKYNYQYEDFVQERFVTFNKMIAYNSRQCTGNVALQVKQDNADFLIDQTDNTTMDSILIDKHEGDWHINSLRDIVINYNIPMFRKDISSLQSEYFIDKIVNDLAVSPAKDWTQLESFRDKFLVVRLIFDNFDNIRLVTNYSIETETPSFR